MTNRTGLADPVTGSRRRNVTAAYDRVAAVYELCAAPMKHMGGAAARQRLLRRARGRVLEVGIGTDRNLGHYWDDVELVDVGISSRMLERARRRAERLARRVCLLQGDVEPLPFPDPSFDTVTANVRLLFRRRSGARTAVVRRVLTPTGRGLLYEHVRPARPCSAGRSTP